MKKKTALLTNLLIWLMASLFLAYKGVKRFDLYFFQQHVSIAVASLLIGLVKGKWVLQKIAQKRIVKIVESPEKVSLATVFPLRFFLLVFSMMGLGMLLQLWDPSGLYLGFFDFAVALALFLGALPYWKASSLTYDKDFSC